MFIEHRTYRLVTGKKAWRDIIDKVSPLVKSIDTKLLLPSPGWDGRYGE